jgi:mannose-1-phosphate guanylyltransferase/mannose-6-phosphate isomerase
MPSLLPLLLRNDSIVIIPVILSGGAGTRLWPLSRKNYPKQFLNLVGDDYTMLQQTVLRVGHFDAPIIVCNEDHRFVVAEQCHSIGVIPSAIILEPVGRNTAPAIALAAIAAQKQDPEAIIAVFPADHAIVNQGAFKASLACAIEAAEQGKLVTFGIVADKPETGYGYLQVDMSSSKDMVARVVERFVEKPDEKTAQSYIDSGDFFWNSGMFVFKASAYLAALSQTNNDIVTCCKHASDKAQKDLDFIRIDKQAFASCPDDSIDYAVMEKADNVVAVPMDVGWSDVGSWGALWDIAQKDENNNALSKDVIAINSHNNLIHSHDKLVAVIGLENMVIVDTKDALLVADKTQMDDLKKVIDELKSKQRNEMSHHREVYRPWGSFDLIDSGQRYQVKRICVKPGASLSLQLHYHRAEHWVVVSGTAIVQINDKEQLVSENESVYIPIAHKHRLTNPGTMPLELIEVQSGSYLGEDDIVRFEDQFGRC